MSGVAAGANLLDVASVLTVVMEFGVVSPHAMQMPPSCPPAQQEQLSGLLHSIQPALHAPVQNMSSILDSSYVMLGFMWLW